jgi:predicted DNA-binding transcriptional regulator YafY
MARSEKQKLKLLYIIQILTQNTDENHYLSMQELLLQLDKFGISAERKSIYSDIRLLQEFGYDIDVRKSKMNGGYALLSNAFELAELKLLVDTVQSSKFITKNKSKRLIDKLEKFTSKYQAKELNRQVYVSNRIKTENENIYYNVDCINDGIQNNKQISFAYYSWNVASNMEIRKNGMRYVVSPWALTFQEENYYLIAYDEENSMIKHYRVDKMKGISTTEDARKGNEEYKKFDLVSYCKKTFGMYGGTEETVTLKMPNSYVGVIFDRFGKDITIRQLDKETFTTRFSVKVSPLFYGWLTGLGTNAFILSPKWIQEDYNTYLENIRKQYKNEEENA